VVERTTLEMVKKKIARIARVTILVEDERDFMIGIENVGR